MEALTPLRDLHWTPLEGPGIKVASGRGLKSFGLAELGSSFGSLRLVCTNFLCGTQSVQPCEGYSANAFEICQVHSAQWCQSQIPGFLANCID